MYVFMYKRYMDELIEFINVFHVFIKHIFRYIGTSARKMTSLGLPTLRTSTRQPWKYVSGTMWSHLLGVSKFLFTFLSELIRLNKCI